jgi:hypothetical protein
MVPAAIALIAAIALLFAGYQVGHFPKAGKPSA